MRLSLCVEEVRDELSLGMRRENLLNVRSTCINILKPFVWLNIFLAIVTTNAAIEY